MGAWVALALVLAGCTGATAGPAGPAASVPASAQPSVPASAPPALPSASPAVVPSGSPALPDASREPALTNPDRTLPPDMEPWPTSIVGATLSLAALDNEFKKAGVDLVVASQERDAALLLGASRGLARIASESLLNAERLTTYPATQAVGVAYLPILRAIEASATAFADALEGGDAAGVEASSQALGAAMAEYALIRADLVDLADIALLMRRGLLVK